MKKMTDKLALAISAWVVLAGGYVSYVNPERRWQCVLGMAVLGAAWLIRHLFHGNTEARVEARRKITQSIAYAGLLLSVGLFEALGWLTASGEFRVRACQFLAGAFVMVIGNAIPKKAVASRRRAALLRANGKAVVLGGWVMPWPGCFCRWLMPIKWQCRSCCSLTRTASFLALSAATGLFRRPDRHKLSREAASTAGAPPPSLNFFIP